MLLMKMGTYSVGSKSHSSGVRILDPPSHSPARNPYILAPQRALAWDVVAIWLQMTLGSEVTRLQNHALAWSVLIFCCQSVFSLAFAYSVKPPKKDYSDDPVGRKHGEAEAARDSQAQAWAGMPRAKSSKYTVSTGDVCSV